MVGAFVADRLADHQRGGRGEDEAVVPRRHRRFEQVQRAGHIGVDERLARITGDVRLVQRAAMDHRLDAIIREGPIDQRPIGNGAHNLGIRARRDVEADDLMPRLAQHRREEPSEPSRRAGEQDAHRPRASAYST